MMRVLAVIAFLLMAKVNFANIMLPALIADNMVLQQRTKVKIWGWGAGNEKVYIKPSWSNTTDSTVVKTDATWSCWIQTPAAGGPFSIEIKGWNTITLSNVMIGEVWVCSGQSNMEMSVNWGLHYDAEVANASNSNIRFFQVPKISSQFPQDDCKAKWEPSDPSTMKNFSAVAYFFGKKLQEELKVPIGLIHASWGGSPAEVWVPSNVVREDQELNAAASKLAPNYSSAMPGANYNAMIHPLINYAVAGAIWYQGESNVGQTTYSSLLKKLILSWRNAWNINFPFYYVQIAPWSGYGTSISAAVLRESQSKVMKVPGTGMVLTSDLVDDIKEIHPQQKKEVGVRLANYALAETYGIKGTIYKSPQFKEMKIVKGKAQISFDNLNSNLISKSGKASGFYVAGADKKFVPAKAIIRGKTVLISSELVNEPAAVRYGFWGAPEADLFSKDGMPVSFFRTDDWDVETINKGNL